MTRPTHVLFIGSTGSTGRLAVDEAVRAGYATRTLVRSAAHARFDPRVDVFQGDLTDIDSLREALDGMDGVVFTMDAHDGPCMVEKVDYGAVRNTLLALDGRKVRIALMTAIGVTYMDTDYNRVSQAHDWKRRSERLVRASGNEYTIVRPGWFDYNDPDQQRLVFLQGDTHRHASPEDGVVSRKQIAQVLVGALGCETPTIRRWSSWPNAVPRRNNSTRFRRTGTGRSESHRRRARRGELPRLLPAQTRTRRHGPHRRPCAQGRLDHTSRTRPHAPRHGYGSRCQPTRHRLP